MDRLAFAVTGQRFRSIALLGAFLPLLVTSVSRAETPRVQFDVAPVIACRDVTTDEFAIANPDERLIEARFEISTYMLSGQEADVHEYLFRFASPGRRLSIVDYQPKTQLASDYAGTISIEKKNQSTRSAGINISGVWDHLIKAGGNADIGSKDDLTVRYEVLAPQEAVTASGTLLRGSAVYFKLRPSSQAALEGARPFLVTFRAPREWRGDYLQIHCEALFVKRGMLGSSTETVRCGARDFFVAIYQQGDELAKRIAVAMSASEAALQKVLQAHRKELSDENRRNVFEPLTSIWDNKAQEFSASREIERLIYTSDPLAAKNISSSLPAPIRSALKRYLTARTAVAQLAHPESRL